MFKKPTHTIRRSIRRLCGHETAVTSNEYATIGAVLVIGLIAASMMFGETFTGMVENVAMDLAHATGDSSNGDSGSGSGSAGGEDGGNGGGKGNGNGGGNGGGKGNGNGGGKGNGNGNGGGRGNGRGHGRG